MGLPVRVKLKYSGSGNSKDAFCTAAVYFWENKNIRGRKIEPELCSISKKQRSLSESLCTFSGFSLQSKSLSFKHSVCPFAGESFLHCDFATATSEGPFPEIHIPAMRSLSLSAT